ncbi:hypothetical protein VQH23_25305 [Pararoseomonas sp. SCSIO 73927]|uniref:hypothetical protein n=1 Tax=Pararoseomonas sp. SCSIO 73927 TaxID=3114537 RepID=UPI0030CC8C84
MSAELERLNRMAEFFLGLADRAGPGPGPAKDFLLDMAEYFLARAVPLDAETALPPGDTPDPEMPEAM